MILIFTLDNQNGVNLSGKRQTKDRVVADKILQLAGSRLHVKQYTTKFFKNTSIAPNYTVVDELSNAPDDAMIFAEEVPAPEMLQHAEKIYVFRWNRAYPSLVQDRLNLDGYHRTIIEEFPGNTHEKITLEVYTR